MLARCAREGMRLVGPLPADTAFLPRKLRGFDAVLAMYHDQGLPVLKYSGFEQAVNLTLGLPYPRVAVDHGTALDLAGTGLADPSSLFAAADTCARMARIAAHIRMSSRPHAFTEPREEAPGPALPARARDHRQDRAGGGSASRATAWSRSARARARSPSRCSTAMAS